MMKKVWNHLRNEKGQGMVEYGLIISLVGVVVAVALTVMEVKLSALFTGLTF